MSWRWQLWPRSRPSMWLCQRARLREGRPQNCVGGLPQPQWISPADSGRSRNGPERSALERSSTEVVSYAQPAARGPRFQGPDGVGHPSDSPRAVRLP
jgi:hypothetical protein